MLYIYISGDAKYREKYTLLGNCDRTVYTSNIYIYTLLILLMIETTGPTHKKGI